MTYPNYMMVLGWKWNLASIAYMYNDLEPILTSFSRRRNMVLIWMGPMM